MSDAIEVLKRIIEESEQEFEKTTIAEIDIFEKELPILKEALLALEQKEKLKELFSNELLERIIQDAYKHGIGSVEIDLRQLWEEIKELEKGVEK